MRPMRPMRPTPPCPAPHRPAPANLPPLVLNPAAITYADLWTFAGKVRDEKSAPTPAAGRPTPPPDGRHARGPPGTPAHTVPSSSPSLQVSVEYMGGAETPWKPGRTDAASGDMCPPNGRLPDASQGAQHLRDIFYRMGFNDQEIVALAGAHTLGRCHTDRSGYDGPWSR